MEFVGIGKNLYVLPLDKMRGICYSTSNENSPHFFYVKNC